MRVLQINHFPLEGSCALTSRGGKRRICHLITLEASAIPRPIDTVGAEKAQYFYRKERRIINVLEF